MLAQRRLVVRGGDPASCGAGRHKPRRLAQALMATLDGPLSVAGLPAYKVDKESGSVKAETPRGCGNSGILPFAAELDPEIASRWYREHEQSGSRRGWRASRRAARFTRSIQRRRFGARAFRVRFGRVRVRHRRGKISRADGPRCAIDPRAGRLLVADAVRLHHSRRWERWPPIADVWGKPRSADATRPNYPGQSVPFVEPVPLLVWLMFAVKGFRDAATRV